MGEAYQAPSLEKVFAVDSDNGIRSVINDR